MADAAKLLCVLAHPDDESMGTGGMLARYAAEGVETYLITATRGQKGWLGPADEYPGPEALGLLREEELRCAARVLQIKEVTVLDYMDGELDQANPDEAIDALSSHIRRIRPNAVVTFDPFGVYGHPDHIAISQFTAAAILRAALGDGAPHQVRKFYYFIDTPDLVRLYESLFGDLVIQIDGVKRRAPGWPQWAVTTVIDARPYARQALEAVLCHRSQLRAYGALAAVGDEQLNVLWGMQTYYRAMSLVNGGRAVETDLFEGIAVPLRAHPPNRKG